MRRLFIRLLIPVLILFIGWIAYQLSDYTKCSGPKAEQWAKSSLQRIDEANADMGTISQISSIDEFTGYASRAQSRYMSQQQERAPSCLYNIQQKTSDALFYEWKAYESSASGDFDLAMTNINQAEISRQDMEKEYYRLAAKYHWDLTK
jgi:hypothetical protein